jgi:hypothetical protein
MRFHVSLFAIFLVLVPGTGFAAGAPVGCPSPTTDAVATFSVAPYWSGTQARFIASDQPITLHMTSATPFSTAPGDFAVRGLLDDGAWESYEIQSWQASSDRKSGDLVVKEVPASSVSGLLSSTRLTLMVNACADGAMQTGKLTAVVTPPQGGDICRDRDHGLLLFSCRVVDPETIERARLV